MSRGSKIPSENEVKAALLAVGLIDPGQVDDSTPDEDSQMSLRPLYRLLNDESGVFEDRLVAWNHRFCRRLCFAGYVRDLKHVLRKLDDERATKGTASYATILSDSVRLQWRCTCLGCLGWFYLFGIPVDQDSLRELLDEMMAPLQPHEDVFASRVICIR